MSTTDSATKASSPTERADALRTRVFDERRAFLAALERPDETRERVLRACVERNVETAFGRDHGFSRIRNADDYAKAVPIRRYDELAPYIERAAVGEMAVLTTSEPVAFLRSSGTTAGAAKKLPVTAEFFRESFLPSYFASLAPLAERCPDAVRRDDATLNLKWDPMAPVAELASGVKHLGASQLDASRLGDQLSGEPGTRAPWAMIPREITDHDERAYVRVRIAVESDVRLVIGLNPSMVAGLHDQLVGSWTRILEELRQGTAGDHLARPKNPARADALERAADLAGAISPGLVWPNLSTIFCWTSGMARLYLPFITRQFGPRAKLFSAPTGSSEAPVTLPLDGEPFRGGALAVHAAYHEFVPADRPLAAHSETCALRDLEVSGLYHVVVTQAGGLYRYAVGDVVRVTGFHGRSPMLDWVGRDPGARAPLAPLADFEAVDAVERASDEALGNDGTTAFGIAPSSTVGGSLRAVVEPRRPWATDEIARFHAALERALSTSSGAYRAHRQAGTLAPVSLHVAARGTFAVERRRRIREGFPPTRVKDRPLLRLEDLELLRADEDTAGAVAS